MPALPTTEDVRQARRQAEAGVAATFDAVRTPLFATLGFLDATTKAVVDAFGKVRSEATGRAGEAQNRLQQTLQEFQSRVADLPAELGELRHRLEAAELRRLYASLSERGEEVFGELRSRPRVQQALGSVESGMDTAQERLERLVGDVNVAVDELRDRFARTSRSMGARVAEKTEEAMTGAAQRIRGTAGTVQDSADDVAETVAEVGKEAADTTRGAVRKVADRTAPPRQPVIKRPGEDTTRKA